ncbi:MAG: hypothetical protein Fur0041_06810 [Bacteroidia bacterium]
MITDAELDQNWEKVLKALEPKFGGDLDLQALLFIIGIQELGHGYKKLKKDDKLNVMHIAICTLLEPYGYYEFQGRDEELWPHWTATAKLPHLKPAQQHRLMREAIVDYFVRNGLIA